MTGLVWPVSSRAASSSVTATGAPPDAGTFMQPPANASVEDGAVGRPLGPAVILDRGNRLGRGSVDRNAMDRAPGHEPDEPRVGRPEHRRGDLAGAFEVS